MVNEITETGMIISPKESFGQTTKINSNRNMAHVKEYSVQEKLASLVTVQKIESKLDELKVLKGELPIEVADLEDEIQGLHARQTRIEEEINGITEFIEQKKKLLKRRRPLVKNTRSKVRM